MIARESEGGGFEFCEINDFTANILLQLPSAADPGDHKAAQQRLFQEPTDAANLLEEWKEFIEPELRSLFESSDSTVAADLEQLQNNGERLLIKPSRVKAWINTLNRARLVLVEKNRFTEGELRDGVRQLESARDMALLAYSIYSAMLELLVGSGSI